MTVRVSESVYHVTVCVSESVYHVTVCVSESCVSRDCLCE